MASQGVFSPEEIGFSKIVETPEEAMELVMKSLPKDFQAKLKTPKSKNIKNK